MIHLVDSEYSEQTSRLSDYYPEHDDLIVLVSSKLGTVWILITSRTAKVQPLTDARGIDYESPAAFLGIICSTHSLRGVRGTSPGIRSIVALPAVIEVGSLHQQNRQKLLWSPKTSGELQTQGSSGSQRRTSGPPGVGKSTHLLSGVFRCPWEWVGFGLVLQEGWEHSVYFACKC